MVYNLYPRVNGKQARHWGCPIINRCEGLYYHSPSFTNRGVELVKMTCLASVIAYAELLHQAKTISTISFNPIESYTVIALTFFTLIYPVTFLVRRLEKRTDR